MRRIHARQTAVGVFLLVLCSETAPAQTMDRVDYFVDQVAEKDEHVVRLAGGSSWLVANRTAAVVADAAIVVMRDVLVSGKPVRTAWLYVHGEEVPAKHVEGVYTTAAAYLTRVVGAESSGTMRLADGTMLSVQQYDRSAVSRWSPPYKALLTGNRVYLYNLKESKRVWVQVAKTKD